ncbi:MAG TPA: hypothetical protein VIL85_16715 [Thermomicrobiales bacterium]
MTATIDAEQAEPTFQPAVRQCVLGDPDEVIAIYYPGALKTRNDRTRELEFQESAALTALADGLIERTGERYAALDKIEIMFLWAEDLGKVAGDGRFIRVQKVNPLTFWALNAGRVNAPRTPDVLVMLNGYMARLAQLTNWQAQAAIHTALECISVRNGAVKLTDPENNLIRNYIIRRYGAWNAPLQTIAAAMLKAQTEQLPLFGDDDEEGEGDE